MSRIKGKAVVAQSGGPTAVINASAAGVIETALANKAVFTAMYGAYNGILGVLHEEMFDLGREDPAEVARLRRSPSAALGSCRHKLKDLAASRADYERILEVFKAHDIRYFFYIGGNDSMDTADKLSQLAGEMDYELTVMGVPKTIDNDLGFTDHCPGYGSVAKYTAVTAMEAGRDTESLYTHDTTTVMEVMGRNAGWIAASSGLARRSGQDAPHLIYMPEVAFVREQFVADVKACLAEFKGCLTLEMVNMGVVPLTLYPGLPIAQLILHTCMQGRYCGAYRCPTGPKPSNVCSDKNKEENEFWTQHVKYRAG